jgi:hypothetical protein
MQSHPLVKSLQDRPERAPRLPTEESVSKEVRSTSILPAVRILAERSGNERRRDQSVDYKQGVNLSVTDRGKKAGNKENSKQVMSKEQAIERINQCRLIFKLKEQLGEECELTPQLRLELLTRITELHRESHSERVRKVVDEYYQKYTRSIIGWPQHSVDNFTQKALALIWDCGQWARELLAAYLARGRAPLGRVLEGCGNLPEADLRQQLQQVL